MFTVDIASFVRILTGWQDADGRISSALEISIAKAIDSNFLPTGAQLPPQREIAKALVVGRGTVSMAMKNLEARGYLHLVQGAGARVRSTRARGSYSGSGRLFSLTNAPRGVIDFSTGALPASEVTTDVLANTRPNLSPYFETDGYFPAGIPLLRHRLAAYLSDNGIPTKPEQLLITNGAQHATNMAIEMWMSQGDTIFCEDPTYRGTLEALSLKGIRTHAIPRAALGTSSLEKYLGGTHDEVLYCQASVHNPTGAILSEERVTKLAEYALHYKVKIIEDCSSFDLTLGISVGRTLAGRIPDNNHLLIGTLSKLFWGGLRIGWIRSSENNIHMLREVRKVSDLAPPVFEQLIAVKLLDKAKEARSERRKMLTKGFELTTRFVSELLPEWDILPVDGGTSIWINTHRDATTLASFAASAGVLLAPGSMFSPSNGFASFLKFPIWRNEEILSRGLHKIANSV